MLKQFEEQFVDAFSTKYENILISGNFNTSVHDETIKDFCSCYCLKSLIEQATYFTNLENPSCIGLVLTSKP